MIYLILAAIALIACHFLIRHHLPDTSAVKNPITIIKSIGLLLYNKGALILVAMVMAQAYLRQNSMPFAELLYLGNVTFAVFLIALVLRLLFFPEASNFAESGVLDMPYAINPEDDTWRRGRKLVNSTMLAHYRFATAVSFAVPTFCAFAVF